MMNDWFTDCRTLDEARAEYRRLCFEHHPDYGGDTLVMQAINTAYEHFKLAITRPRPANDGSRRHWQRRPRQRPTDIPRNTSAWSRPPEPERRPIHPREYFRSIWNRSEWQAIGHEHMTRTIWNHTVTIFRHPDPKFASAWFLVVDDVFSPYFYDNQSEAEHAAFDLIYEKVKYLDA